MPDINSPLPFSVFRYKKKTEGVGIIWGRNRTVYANRENYESEKGILACECNFQLATSGWLTPSQFFYFFIFFLSPAMTSSVCNWSSSFQFSRFFFLPLLVSFSHSADTLHISLENWSSNPSSRLGFCSAFVSSQQSFV